MGSRIVDMFGRIQNNILLSWFLLSNQVVFEGEFSSKCFLCQVPELSFLKKFNVWWIFLKERPYFST